MMKFAQRIHDLLKRSNYRCYFSTDMKHDYWNVLMHSKNRHYLIFHVSNIDQLQFIRQFQRTKISSFIFIELINIIFDFISNSNAKSSLLYALRKTSFFNIFFYIDDIFEAHRIFEKQYNFLKNHFFFDYCDFKCEFLYSNWKSKSLNSKHSINYIESMKFWTSNKNSWIKYAIDQFFKMSLQYEIF